MASDVADIHDIDLEVYGTKIDDVTATTTSTITSYNFEVCTIYRVTQKYLNGGCGI